MKSSLPRIIDTKLMAMTPPLKEDIIGSTLEELVKILSKTCLGTRENLIWCENQMRDAGEFKVRARLGKNATFNFDSSNLISFYHIIPILLGVILT